MKKILLIVACALLSPMHLLDAAQEAKSTTRTAARKTTAKKTTAAKTGAKKPAAAQKTTAAKSKSPRVKTTTAGSKTTKPVAASSKKAATTKAKPAAKKTTASGSKKTTAARTKTTTAGTKAKAAKKSPKTTKATTASRAKKSTYSSTKKPATKKAASKKATGAQQPKRVYRKGGVKYRRFDRLNNMVPQQLGAINNPVTQNVALNKPGRGYVNANLINFTTPDGKEGQVVLDTHTISPRRAERKGFSANTHGKQSVEVFAGSDATGKGLALIGEYPLTTDNVHISVDPSGHVTLSGAAQPIEFSIHQ